MSLFDELKRRNVLRVGTAYVVTSWLLIQVAETIFPLFGLDDTLARILVIVLGIGIIPALTFAWAFELTPEGLKKEKDVDRSRSTTLQTSKKLDLMIMVMLALALAYFALDKFVLSKPREALIAETARQEGRSEALIESYGDKSIAVLPFADLSPQGDQEYFSDGIAEELLNLLAKIPELRVISRSSAFSFRGKDMDIPTIASQLQVAHVLEGSVRKAGTRVRITAQLIDARSDTHLWSQTFDRTLDDIFAIQDEIAAEVVEQLKVTLLGNAPRARQTDPEAFALFLQARYFLDQFTAESLEKSAELYQRALALDPEYPPALKGLAEVTTNLAAMGHRPFEESIEFARVLVHKSVAIDPLYADAYAGLGSFSQYFDNDLKSAARHFEKAVELGPSQATIVGDAGIFALHLGRTNQAISLLEHQVALDPVSPTAHYQLARAFRAARRFDEAAAAYRTVLNLSPGRIYARYGLGISLMLHGDLQRALQEVNQVDSQVSRLTGQALVYHLLDQPAESNAALEELADNHAQDAASYIAAIHAFRNETESAFAWLTRAEEDLSIDMLGINTNPLFASLHDDPRWQAFLERQGYSEAQLASIRFDVKIPD